MKQLIFLVLMFGGFFSKAQVQSNAYQVMLQALLSHSVPEVSVEQAKKLPGVTWLDAREPAEYKVSHIANSINVGFDHFNVDAINHLPRNQPIVVYCSVGYRSEKIADRLQAEGFTHVSNLFGGVFEWVNQENPLVDESGQVTPNVHAYSKTWSIWLTKGVKVYE